MESFFSFQNEIDHVKFSDFAKNKRGAIVTYVAATRLISKYFGADNVDDLPGILFSSNLENTHIS